MYILQIKVEDGVIKELLGFQCFVVMFPDGDCIRITIRILQKTEQHSAIALDQNFATYL
jgi:hypothetical protein